jgi:exodeoxyribonuclease VII large subunit
VQIILYPATVQGEGAVPSIVKGIRMLESIGVDVMIVGRGGGSIEDLWAFNEREVAEAVFNCSVPVISAVGHETDTTIIDFVADLRAPTPSAAAELAVADIREIFSGIDAYREMLNRLMNAKLKSERERFRHMELGLRAGSPASRIREKRMSALQAEERLQTRMKRIMEGRRHELAIYIERMKRLSPLEKLNSGYSYVADDEGTNIRSVTQVSPGENLMIQVSDGRIGAVVREVLPTEAGLWENGR